MSQAADARPQALVSELISYAVGCALGRWDVRHATGESRPPELPDSFAPLPLCSPGMLQGPDGLPATPEITGPLPGCRHQAGQGDGGVQVEKQSQVCGGQPFAAKKGLPG